MTPAEIFKKVRRIQIQTNRLASDILAGSYRSVFKGKGLEFEEVREYQPGDEIRHVDWNVTARMNSPFVKIFREERELTLMLMVDVSGSAHFGKKKELIAEVGGILSFSAIKNNDRVGLILFSDRVEKYLPPRRGTRHVLWVIRELLNFQPASRGTDINAALSFYGKLQKQTGICFLISDFIQADYAHSMQITAQRHDLIAVHTIDPLEKQMVPAGLVEFQDLETGEMTCVDTADPGLIQFQKLQYQKRKRYLQTVVNKAGIGLIELPTDQPYLPLLRKFFNSRERRL